MVGDNSVPFFHASPTFIIGTVVIKRAIFLGDLTQVHVDWGGRELIIRQTGAATPAEGSTAFLSIDSGHCVLLEPE